jgi:hypothetical protein
MKNITGCIPSRTFMTPILRLGVWFVAISVIAVLVVSGASEAKAQTPAIVGRKIYGLNQFSPQYQMSLESYIQTVSSNNESSLVPSVGGNRNLDRKTIEQTYNKVYSDNNLYTNNGILSHHAYFMFISPATQNSDGVRGYYGLTYVNLNDLTVNKVMTASPLGSLKVTPVDNEANSAKVQWKVE